MYVVELMYPGTRIDLADVQRASQLKRIIDEMVEQLAEAAVAVSAFEQARDHPLIGSRRMQTSEEFDAEGARVSEIARGLEAELGGRRLTNAEREEISDRARAQAKRERWAAGAPPEGYENAFGNVPAKTFVRSLDLIGKITAVLAQEDGVPANTKGDLENLKEALDSSFPVLKDLRDSVSHPEDRVRRKKAFGKPMGTAPVESWIVSAPQGGPLVKGLNWGMGAFGLSLADGSYGEIEVSRASLDVVQRHVQAVIDAFPWRGPKRHWP